MNFVIMGAQAFTSDDGVEEPEDTCVPVYEPTSETVTGQRLVLTTWMMLDELVQCQEEMEHLLNHIYATGIGQERRYGCACNPVADRLEKAHFNVSHVLRLLRRGGLWTEGEVAERTDAQGRTFHVIEQPFTTGKSESTVSPRSIPDWKRELLGMAPNSEPENMVPGLRDMIRRMEPATKSIQKAA